ncbi:MAG: hypothetical protein NE328_08910, partial [Lentisphaeraceae bacterium]|nr:hypothetical protein [Lentisphaeraceae bacterium]
IKNPPLKLKFYSALLRSDDSNIRKDSFRNLLFASKRNEVDQTLSDQTLKTKLALEKDPAVKKYMETTLYRDKIRVLKSVISKDPSKSEEAFSYINSFPHNEDIVKDALSCLIRAKNENIPTFLNTNFQALSPKSLEEACQLLYLELRKGNKDYLPFFNKALESKDNDLRLTAFEKLCSSVYSSNPLGSEIKSLLQKAISAESDDVNKRKMADRFKRLK